jgi:hypothetical protein
MSQNVNIIIPEFELQKFRDCWAEFDKDVRTKKNDFELL